MTGLNILITGADGQLGRALQTALKGHNIIATNRRQLDITDPAAVRSTLAKTTPDIVINAAAYTAVDKAETEREMAWQINADGPALLARATESSGAKIIHISTDYVFDGKADQPYSESAPPAPLSIYGKSKLAGERHVAAINPRHFIIRTAWLFHEHGQNFLRSMWRHRHEPLRVVDDQIGCPTHACDLTEAIATLIRGEAYGLHHIAAAGTTSWHGLATEFFRQLGMNVNLTPIPTSAYPRPAPRPPYSALISERPDAIALPPWQQGVARLTARIKANGWD